MTTYLGKKFFQRLLHMFNFYIDNDLVSLNQSGFKSRVSCIIHTRYEGDDVWAVFLDNSNVFDKV